MDAIRGAHAIVTGGSSGIGLATAAALAKRGAHVSLVARDEARLASAATSLRHLGGDVVTVAVDVADRAALRPAVSEVIARRGPCRILVTSAGVVRPGDFRSLDHGTFREQMEVNYFGTLNAVEAVVPSMVDARRGSLVGVSSAAGLLGIYGYTAYAPTKFAVRGLFECLRAELRPFGVHVACVFPPDVDTPQLEYEDRLRPPETSAITGAVRPLAPDVVAAAIVRGIDRRRFEIVPDLRTRLLARTSSLLAGPLRGVIDSKVRRARAGRRS